MDCRTKSRVILATVYTPKSTTSWVFVPVGPAIRATAITEVRVQIEVVSIGPDTQIKRSRRTSANGVEWGAGAPYDVTPITATGWHYEEAFSPLDAEWVQFGVEVKNFSNQGKQAADVQVVVEGRAS